MLTTCQKSRLKNPRWCGFSEAPYSGMRLHTLHPDIAQWVEQQTVDLCVAGSNPAISLALLRPLNAIRS